MDIRIVKTQNPKNKPDPGNFGFGNYFSDHMFAMNYYDGEWKNHRIIPYGVISLEPSAMVFHYAQETFEGLKAYKNIKGGINLFRPEKNFHRLNASNDRMCIPRIDVNETLEALYKLVDIDRDWIPVQEGCSLYIRPFIIATDPIIGVRKSENYQFYIILSPVGSYYKEGLNPTKIHVEDQYVRAIKGGIGIAKTGGNYAASINAQLKAKQNGFAQVLWLDGIERKYIEEIGTSNAFFIIDGNIITPSLDGTILPGITRDSVISLLKDWGMIVIERKLSIQEVYDAYNNGKLGEAFATGTAAVISPIGDLCWNGNPIAINGGK